MFEVEEWLHSRIGLNFRSGLGRMQQAVDLLPLPPLISSPSMTESALMDNQ